MPDFLRVFSVSLVKLAQALPTSYERCRQFVHEGRIPSERDEKGRIYIRRDFALRLAKAHPDFPTLADAISHLNSTDDMSNPNSDEEISTTTAALAEKFNVSHNRITQAAKNAPKVFGWRSGMIETSEDGLSQLEQALSDQLN